MMMTKITHRAFAQPPMSWLRKMSMKTMISSQIQMKNKKKYSIDRKASRTGYVEANMWGSLSSSGRSRAFPRHPAVGLPTV